MAFIKGFGAYRPERLVENSELAEVANCDAAWIREMSGIEQRRFAGRDEGVVEMGANAARDCLNRTGLSATDIGLLIVSSGSSPQRFPGPAAAIGHALGMDGIAAFDLPMASTGALVGMHLAARLAAVHGNVLVVAAEKMSEIALQEPIDRNTAILFGDGAGACVIGPDSGIAEVLDGRLHSDGAFAADLRLDFGRPIEMNGRTVILQASRKIPAVIEETLSAVGCSAAEVDVFLMHQANQNLIARVARALNVAPEKFFSNIHRYGNTSSASMLIAASEWFEMHRLAAGYLAVFAVFGAGFHWGSLAARGT